ncbi:MAG: hypothetical protein RLZZ200_1512 [Pseudomonadota bacterium]
MKLVRFGAAGMEKPGLVDGEGQLRDLSGIVRDVDGSVLGRESLARLRALDPRSLPLVPGTPRFGSAVAGVGKFIAIGLNYSDHARETGSPIPKIPIVFSKFTSCIGGPYDDVMLPRGSTKSDWEVELGVVIGTRARYVDVAEALDYVAGYCVINDLSEREYQLEHGPQWDKGKGCDTFGPIGPWLVTTDEIRDPQCLDMWLDVNGERMQTGNTRTMVFPVAQLVSHLSEYTTLEPGDVITTGTPPGVGLAMKPARFLRAGDRITLGIEGLGQQSQTVVAWRR